MARPLGTTGSALLAAGALALAGCARLTEHRVGLADGELTKCPEWPRCVSSQADDPDKLVDPLRLTTDSDAGWAAARAAVAETARTEIVVDKPRYVRAEVTSPWGVYTDDLELLRQPDGPVIHVRSTARIGYYDFGVNRERVERLRADLAERGVVAGES